MGLGLCWPRQGWQQVKRDTRMGFGLRQPRQGRQQVKRDMRMGTAAGEKGYENGIGAMSAEARTAAGERDMRMGLPKGLNLRLIQRMNPGRSSMQSSMIMTRCQSQIAHYILGKRTSCLVLMVKSRWRLQ